MFISTALDVALGLVLIYFSLSIGCSALVEWGSAVYGRRARSLREEVRTLFGADTDRHGFQIFLEVYTHPLLRGTYPKPRDWQLFCGPVWIPNPIFADALLDVLARGRTTAVEALRGIVGGLKDDGNQEGLIKRIDELDRNAVDLMIAEHIAGVTDRRLGAEVEPFGGHLDSERTCTEALRQPRSLLGRDGLAAAVEGVLMLRADAAPRTPLLALKEVVDGLDGEVKKALNGAAGVLEKEGTLTFAEQTEAIKTIRDQAKRLGPGHRLEKFRLFMIASELEFTAAVGEVERIAKSYQESDSKRDALTKLTARLRGAGSSVVPPPMEPSALRGALQFLPAGCETRLALVPLLDSIPFPLQPPRAEWLAAVRSAVTDWFQAAGDRMTDRYKQDTQFFMFIAGLIISVIFNADTFTFVGRMWRDPLVRTAMAASAARAATDPKLQAEAGVGLPAPPAAPGPPPPPSATVPANPVRTLEEVESRIRGYKFPLGWYYCPPDAGLLESTRRYEVAVAALGEARIDFDRANEAPETESKKTAVEDAACALDCARNEVIAARRAREVYLQRERRRLAHLESSPEVVARRSELVSLASRAEEADRRLQEAEAAAKAVAARKSDDTKKPNDTKLAEAARLAREAHEAYDKARSKVDELVEADLRDRLDNRDFWIPNDFIGIVLKVFGLIITAVALTMGGPFWFDVLNSIVNVRSSAVKRSDESKSA